MGAEKNKPSKKKILFPVRNKLRDYLKDYNRYLPIPIDYSDMTRYFASTPLRNKKGEDLHWQTVYFAENESKDIDRALCKIYALLKTDGDLEVIEHLKVDRIDFCLFGNTNPFRVRIINRLNDNYDHFYIKQVDASRVYGIELENLLSPNSFSFLIDENTLIEEHIAGIPGDDFAQSALPVEEFDQIRIAKEFIKFNERCFVRLLGDMRAYNFIVDITPDIEGNQYRIRAIDFDQQSYEGHKKFYLPQFFKENNPIIELGFKHLDTTTVKQYQYEERTLIGRRAKNDRERLNKLLKIMVADPLSSPEKVEILKSELGEHHQSNAFKSCTSMGDIVLSNLQLLLQKDFKQSTIDIT